MFNMPIGIIILIINTPLFIISIKYMGKDKGIKSLFTTFMLSLAIDTTSFLSVITEDALPSSLYGGIILGVGLGLVLRFIMCP